MLHVMRHTIAIILASALPAAAEPFFETRADCYEQLSTEAGDADTFVRWAEVATADRSGIPDAALPLLNAYQEALDDAAAAHERAVNALAQVCAAYD